MLDTQPGIVHVTPTLPSSSMAGDGGCNHPSVAVPEAAPAFVLPFSGASGLMSGSGTMYHCQPHEAPVGLPICLAPPRHAKKTPHVCPQSSTLV